MALETNSYSAPPSAATNSHFVSKYPDPCFLVELETGKVLDFNVLALELLDYESQELSGKSIFDLVPDLSRDEYSSYVAQTEGRVLTAFPASQFLRRDRSTVSADLYMGLTTVDGNKALLTVARDRAERDARELASLVKIGSVISESPEIADVYEEFASVASGLVQFDRMTICEIYEDDRLSPVHVSGMKVKGWEPGTLHHLDETVMRPAVRDHSSLLVETRILKERRGDD
ncbi:MAG: PAS domain-containing protein, partial [Nitrospirae bacterium]|nr:PAS domain-containing protein [Nitrospirota bacterium]